MYWYPDREIYNTVECSKWVHILSPMSDVFFFLQGKMQRYIDVDKKVHSSTKPLKRIIQAHIPGLENKVKRAKRKPPTSQVQERETNTNINKKMKRKTNPSSREPKISKLDPTSSFTAVARIFRFLKRASKWISSLGVYNSSLRLLGPNAASLMDVLSREGFVWLIRLCAATNGFSWSTFLIMVWEVGLKRTTEPTCSNQNLCSR